MLRKAAIADARAIHRLLADYAQQGMLLPRSLPEIYTTIRSFYVYQTSTTAPISGTVCLQIWWEDLAEVRSLAVSAEAAGQGVGKQLVAACLEEARQLGIERVFALTYQQSFFERQGFTVIDKQSLPQKIWGDCVKCPKFPDCDEIAMELRLAEGTVRTQGP